MNGVTQEQRDAILTKAEALAGEPLGEAGALLAEIACERVTVSDKSGRIYHARASDSVRYPSHCVTVVEVFEVSVPASQESAEGGTADQKG